MVDKDLSPGAYPIRHIRGLLPAILIAAEGPTLWYHNADSTTDVI
jgi:hypothetical protein